MNELQFRQAMGEIRDEYLEEAMAYQSPKKSHGWVKWGAVAACLAAAVAVGILWAGQRQDTQTADHPEHPQMTQQMWNISMEDMVFNRMGEWIEANRIWFDPALYDEQVWDAEDIQAYFGRDLTPAYLPEGLKASRGNGTTTVVVDKDGNLEMDTVWMRFFHDFYEDGSPKLTQNVAAAKGISIAASRLGILTDCIYLLPENEVETSMVGDTEVTLGYRSMSYGPYDPDTHEPSGYYDMYVAEFQLDGVEYQVVSEQIEAEEFVKVVASLICGTTVTVQP